MSGSLNRWHVTKPGQTVMSIFWSTWILTGVFLMSGVSRWISLLLDRPVDVVTEAGLRERIRSRVLREARAL